MGGREKRVLTALPSRQGSADPYSALGRGLDSGNHEPAQGRVQVTTEGRKYLSSLNLLRNVVINPQSPAHKRSRTRNPESAWQAKMI